MHEPYPFLDESPEGFDRTNEIKWIPAGTPSEPMPAVLSYNFTHDTKRHHFDAPVYVLCQKWTGAFRDVWVRVPVQE